METRFTWDSAKAEKNQRIHGISFEKAKEVFDDRLGRITSSRERASSVTRSSE
jgi:uncharacterized DUF497 family protein